MKPAGYPISGYVKGNKSARRLHKLKYANYPPPIFCNSQTAHLTNEHSSALNNSIVKMIETVRIYLSMKERTVLHNEGRFTNPYLSFMASYTISAPQCNASVLCTVFFYELGDCDFQRKVARVVAAR